MNEHTTTSSASIADHCVGPRGHGGRLPARLRRSWRGLATGSALALLLLPLPAASRSTSAREVRGDALAPAQSAPAAGGAWADTGPLNMPRHGHTLTLLPDGTVLAIGSGGNDSAAPVVAEVERYSPGTGAWALQASLRPPRRRHCATLLPSGLVVVAGGDGGPDQALLPGALTFDPTTGALIGAGTLQRPRSFCTLTALPDGRALLIGGGAPGFLAEVEAYNPATSTWTVLGALKQAREYHTATLLPDGSVLVAGGAGAGGRLASLERFDPRTGQSTIVATMSTPRGFHTATLLPDGMVLIAGGDGGGGDGFPATAERFDPATNTVRPAGTMRGPRRHHTATLLPDGLVLVAGGDKNGPLATTELYDPASDAWSEAAPMRWPRRWHTATLLPDGRVLAAGGEGAGGPLASAEIYAPDASPCADPPPGMVAWWPLDETSGTTAEDIAGANDGSYVNQPAVVPDGQVAASRHFDGATQSIQVPDAADGALDFGLGDFTVDAWVRLDADARGVRTIVDKRSFGPVRGYAVFAIDGKLALQLGDGSAPGNACGSDPATTPCTSYNSGIAINDGQWHFVAVTVDRDGVGTFYVDGQTASFDPSRRTGNLDNAAPLVLARHASNGGFWKGALDEVEIFGRAVPAAELQAIRRAGAAGKCKDGGPGEPWGDRSLQETLDHVYAPLDVAQVPGGILLDRTVPFSHLASAVPSQEVVYTAHELRQLYREMFNGAWRRPNQPTPDELGTVDRSLGGGSVVPIAVLHYVFGRVRSDAFDKGLLELRDGQIHDVPGRTESPYLSQELFAAAPLLSKARGPEVTFFVDPSLLLTNQGATLDELEIDFGDGRGFQRVVAGSQVSVTYGGLPAPPGSAVKRLRLRWTPPGLAQGPSTGVAAAGQAAAPAAGPLVAEMSLPISAPPAAMSADAEYFFTAASSSPGAMDDAAKVSVQKGAGSPAGCFSRPLVFVEGIDFGPVPFKPPAGWQNHSFLKHLYDLFLVKYQIDLPLMRGDMGFECLQGKCADYPQLAKGPELLKMLKDRGDDVLFVDFWNGADYIQNDAAVLQRVLEYTRGQLCPGSRTVVVGASMGGLISRHALATMEKNSNSHCTTTWIAFDSPQEGANIPVGAQHFIDFFAEVNEDAKDAKDNKLGRPGARQLLIAQSNPNSLHAAWQAELSALGYPGALRRVAVPNGSTTGKALGFGDGAKIIHITPIKALSLELWGDAFALPGVNDGLVFDAKLFRPAIKKKNKIDLRKWAYAPVGLPALDNGPGGQTGALTAFEIELFKIGDEQILPIIGAEDWVTFIPTASALGWTAGMAEPHQAPPANAPSPFSEYYKHADNQDHVEITAGNIAYLKQVLDRGGLVPGSLPVGTSVTSFNFGHTLAQLDHSLTIAAGGRLGVNLLGPTDDGSGAPTPSGSAFEAQVINDPACGGGNTVIDVHSGGTVELGAVDRKGVLRFRSGTTLRLRAGAKLVAHKDSVLIIEPGATLIYDQGATIDLKDDKSVIQMQGKTQIGAGAVFTFAGKGYLNFIVMDKAAPSILAGPGARMEFVGSGADDWLVEVSGGSLFWPEDSLALFSVRDGEVVVTGQSEIRLGSRYRFVNTTFKGAGTITSWSRPKSWINLCTFDGVKFEVFAGYGGTFQMSNSTLRNVGTAVTLFGSGLTFDRVTIEDNVDHGVVAIGRTLASYIDLSDIRAEATGIHDLGSTGARLLIRGTTVTASSGTGVVAGGGEVALRQSKVHGKTYGALAMDDAVLDMSTITGAGCNDLSYDTRNDSTLIRLQQALFLALDNGYNDLANGPLNASSNANDKGGPILTGSLNNTIFQWLGCQLSADHNVWSASDAKAAPQNFAKSSQIALSAPKCAPLQVTDKEPSGSCPGDGDPGPLSGQAAALSVCATCPTLNTPDFRGVPYNQAITQAMARLARDSGDPAKDDLVAIRQFSQILGTPVDTSKPELAWLRGLAFRMLNDGFGNALATERISTTVAAGPLPEPVRQVQAAYTFLASARNTPDRGERFRYELGGALTHRQVGRRAEASAALAAIVPAGLTRPQRATLARWQRLVSAEEQLARGDISLELFRVLVTGPDPYIPAPPAVYLPVAWQARR